MVKTLIARWETRGQRYWYELYRDNMGFTFRSEDGGGNLGYMALDTAMANIEQRVRDAKRFDNINMKQVL